MKDMEGKRGWRGEGCEMSEGVGDWGVKRYMEGVKWCMGVEKGGGVCLFMGARWGRKRGRSNEHRIL